MPAGAVLPVRIINPDSGNRCHAEGVTVKVLKNKSDESDETMMSLELHDHGRGLAQCLAAAASGNDETGVGVLRPTSSFGATGYATSAKSLLGTNTVLRAMFALREETGGFISLYKADAPPTVTANVSEVTGDSIILDQPIGDLSGVEFSIYKYSITGSSVPEMAKGMFPKGATISVLSEDRKKITMSSSSLKKLYQHADGDVTLTFGLTKSVGDSWLTTPIATFPTTMSQLRATGTIDGNWGTAGDAASNSLTLIARDSKTPLELVLEPKGVDEDNTTRLSVARDNEKLWKEHTGGISVARITGIVFRAEPPQVTGAVSLPPEPTATAGGGESVTVSVSGYQEDAMYSYSSFGKQVNVPPSNGGNGWCLPKIRVDENTCTPATGGMTVLTDERGGMGFTCVCKNPFFFTQAGRGLDCTKAGQGLCVGGVFRVRALDTNKSCTGNSHIHLNSSIPVVCDTTSGEEGYAFFDLKAAAAHGGVLSSENFEDPLTQCSCPATATSKKIPGNPYGFECAPNSCSPGIEKSVGNVHGCVCPPGFVTNKKYDTSTVMPTITDQPFPDSIFGSGGSAGTATCLPDPCANSIDQGESDNHAVFKDHRWQCHCDGDKGFAAYNELADPQGMRDSFVAGSCRKPCDMTPCGGECKTCFQLKSLDCDAKEDNARMLIPVCTKCDCPFCNSYTSPPVKLDIFVASVQDEVITVQEGSVNNVHLLRPGDVAHHPSRDNPLAILKVASTQAPNLVFLDITTYYDFPEQLGCVPKANGAGNDMHCAKQYKTGYIQGNYKDIQGQDACIKSKSPECQYSKAKLDNLKLTFERDTPECLQDRDDQGEDSAPLGNQVFTCTGFRRNNKMRGEICDSFPGSLTAGADSCCGALTCTKVSTWATSATNSFNGVCS